jgi:phosphoserine phosphatase
LSNGLRITVSFLVLISASPIEVVSVIASKLHFDEAYGLKLETKDGIYTGKFFTVTSKYKRNVIKRKLKEYRFFRWSRVITGMIWKLTKILISDF